jgi:hypothetical protein
VKELMNCRDVTPCGVIETVVLEEPVTPFIKVDKDRCSKFLLNADTRLLDCTTSHCKMLFTFSVVRTSNSKSSCSNTLLIED